MENNKPTLEYLKKLKEEFDAEKERFNLALFFNICPECGSTIERMYIGYDYTHKCTSCDFSYVSYIGIPD